MSQETHIAILVATSHSSSSRKSFYDSMCCEAMSLWRFSRRQSNSTMSGRRHPLAARPEWQFRVCSTSHRHRSAIRLHPRCPIEGARSIGVHVTLLEGATLLRPVCNNRWLDQLQELYLNPNTFTLLRAAPVRALRRRWGRECMLRIVGVSRAPERLQGNESCLLWFSHGGP